MDVKSDSEVMCVASTRCRTREYSLTCMLCVRGHINDVGVCDATCNPNKSFFNET